MMNLLLPAPGNYVVAVSGGLDSSCLLDILAQSADYRLVVAHFDHGMRKESAQDATFVKALAESKGLIFYSQTGNLGDQASEQVAREARYAFLRQVQHQESAQAIITAHHLDDRIETLIINLIRGTGRLGMTSLGETATIKRPLLNIAKDELLSYAQGHNLDWREDRTNLDAKYLRNYVRLRVINRISSTDKQRIVNLINNQSAVNQELDGLFSSIFSNSRVIDRRLIDRLDYKETSELIAAWLRYNNLGNFNHRIIDRLTIGVKTKRPGTKLDVYNRIQVSIFADHLALNRLEC